MNEKLKLLLETYPQNAMLLMESFAAGRAYQSKLDKDAVAWGTAGIVAALDKAAEENAK